MLERSSDEHDPETGGSIVACTPCDITKKEEIEKLVKEISSKEDKVNILGTVRASEDRPTRSNRIFQ